MPREFTLTESWSSQKINGGSLPLLLQAVDELNRALTAEKVPLVSLAPNPPHQSRQATEIIDYTVTSTQPIKEPYCSVTEASFDVSHFIGSYTTTIGQEEVTLRLEPRWGNAILSYLLQYTTGIYQPPAASAKTAAQKDTAAWLLAMLWKSHFTQALRTYHLPKQYQTRKTNDRYFRGRLDVPRHIRDNSVDQSRFACVDSPLTWDTTIGRTLRHVYRLLSGKEAFPSLMRDLSSTDEKLASFGVKATDVRPEEIDTIRYTRLSEGYRTLMQTSKAVIRRFGGSNNGRTGEVPSYFIDMAELWENYLLAVLKRHLPPEYRVFSPNIVGGDWLFQGSKRQIRPDLLIERQGVIVAVIDAKFKEVREIGTCEKGGVSREDLYQMSTYLYHYGCKDQSILGLFITPVAGDVTASVEILNSASKHRMGVLTFDVSRWDKTTEINLEVITPHLRATELAFSQSLKNELSLSLTMQRES